MLERSNQLGLAAQSKQPPAAKIAQPGTIMKPKKIEVVQQQLIGSSQSRLGEVDVKQSQVTQMHTRVQAHIEEEKDLAENDTRLRNATG